ncbi:hypothetical protein F4819DRAFT_414401 [Hypoxylon fuscum]|nr:hypothetical protein F4819DRAFT_414401 [Hypoxylon fuscum]
MVIGRIRDRTFGQHLTAPSAQAGYDLIHFSITIIRIVSIYQISLLNLFRVFKSMSDDSNSKNAATQTNPISPGQVQALLFTLQQLSENLAPLRELAEFNSKQAVRQGNATGHTTTAQAPTIGTAAEDEQHTTLGDFLVTCAPTEQRLRRVLDCFCDLISGSGCDYRQYCVGRYADSSQGYLILRLREGYKTMPICAEPNHFGPEPGDSLMIQDISARVIELWPKAFCTVMETPAQKLIWDLSMLHKHGASYSIGADGYPKHTRIVGLPALLPSSKTNMAHKSARNATNTLPKGGRGICKLF